MRHAADRDLEPHRDHRAGARPARGDRLDRRRVHHRLAGDGPLLPHHARRADRLRLGRGPGRASARAPHGRAELDPAWSSTRSERHLRPLLPRARGPADRARLGRADRRLADPPAGDLASSSPGSTAPSATRATASGRRTWSAARSPRWRSSADDEASRLAFVDPPPQQRPARAVSLPRRQRDPARDPAPGGGARARPAPRPGHPRRSPRIPERIGHPHRALSLLRSSLPAACAFRSLTIPSQDTSTGPLRWRAASFLATSSR